jgi:demethylmenaquinone methyltransferase/2-methoxy-6-polyprenyl-1,4-benzoquinol methylase
VLFVDDAHRTEEELVEGAASATVERRLGDGAPHRAIKVPHEPDHLQREIRRLGWDVTVHATRGPFYWGAGRILSAQAPAGV